MASPTDQELRGLLLHSRLDSDHRSLLRALILDHQRLRAMEEALSPEKFEDALEDVFGANDSWDWDTTEGVRPATLNREVITEKILNLVEKIVTPA